jgi:predicted RNase H-like HicB family nuclease
MTREFTAVIVEDDGWFVAWAEELPGANTQGRTIEEATENLKDAIQLILEARREEEDNELVGRVVRRQRLDVAVA